MRAFVLASLGLAIVVAAAFAQSPAPERKPGWSNDQSPLQRDLMVVDAILPGTYNNYEQTYFNRRLNVPDDRRHRLVHTEIRRIPDARFGEHAFYVQDHLDDDPSKQQPRIYSFSIDEKEKALRMESYYFVGLDLAPYLNAHDDLKKLDGLAKDKLTYVKGCDLFFARINDGFHGRMKPKACVYEERGEKVYADFQIMISNKSLWKGDVIRRLKDDRQVNEEPKILHKQNRARWFACSLTLGEGPEATRFTNLSIMDQGGTAWVPVPDPEHPDREVGLHIRNVDWAMNNSRTAFTNDVFSFYLDERWKGQERRHIMYTWGAADSERLGINLLYMQAYCVLKEAARSNPKL
jgi:hypothetical protein